MGVWLGAELMEGVGLVQCNTTSLGAFAFAFAGGAVLISIVLVFGKDSGFWRGMIGGAKLGEELGAGDCVGASDSSIEARGVLFLGMVLLGAFVGVFVGTIVGFSISRP